MEKKPSSKDAVIAASQYFKEKDYWLSKLSGNPENSFFPCDYSRLNTRSRDIEEVKFKFNGDIFSRLMKVSKETNPKLYMILATGLAALINKYSGSKDITFFVPIYKQKIEADFINTVLPLRNQFEDGMTFKDLIMQMKDCIQEATRYQNYPIETILYDLNSSFFYEKSFLVNIALLLENIHDLHYIQHINPNICFNFRGTGEALDLSLQYNSLLYKRTQVERIVNHYSTLIGKALADVNLPLSSIDIFTEEEKEQLLIHFNNSAAEYPKYKTVQELFAEQVKKQPGNIAVAYEYEGLSYQELNERANHLAQLLRKKGMGPDTIAAMMVEPSLEMIVGIIGILKAGGAYLPIAIELPRQRVSTMLEDSGAFILLTRKRWAKEVDYRCEIIDFDEETISLKEPHNPDIINNPVDAAYVVYTSGSTGKAKGVVVGHQSILNYIYWRITKLEITPADVSLQLVSFSFDGFNANLYPALLSGGRVILLNLERWDDQVYIRNMIREKKVTNFSVVPSMFRILLDGAKEGDFAALRFVVLAGEKADEGVVTLSKQVIPHARFINEYGPTENSVAAAAYFEMTADKVSLIGAPISNNQIYILDENRKLLPINVNGELCISGDSLARGYLNRPELTWENFIPNPYFPGARMYKTGDLARWEEDGNIGISGRVDRQVKIRGFRIEPEEIETWLRRHEDITDVAIVPKTDRRGDLSLCAYVVLTKEAPVVEKNPAKTDSSDYMTAKVSEFKEFLSEELPDYMVPLYFEQLKEMPLTTSGKIDRKKLAEMELTALPDDEYVAPLDETQKILVEIWKDFLAKEKLGIKCNFFNIGGDSIKSISLLNIINKRFSINLKVVDLYENETIEKLSHKINKNREDLSNERVQEIRKELEVFKERMMTSARVKEHIEDIYPMSDIEKGMILYYLRNPGTSVYHNQMVLHWTIKNFDENILRKTLDIMVKKHPMLRTCYNNYDFEEPVHIVFSEISFDIECFNISHLDDPGKTQHIGSILEKDKERHFSFNGEKPLWRAKVFTLNSKNICFLWSCHHAMIDGWSAATLLTELNNTYLKLRAGEDITSENLKNSYKEFVIEQLVGKKNPQVFEYWEKELAGYKRLQLPMKPTNINDKETLKSYINNFSVEYLGKISKAATGYNTSVKHLCFAAYIYMLSMLTYENDVVVGLVTHNRPVCQDSEKIIGCFLNTVPVRMIIPARIRCTDYIDKIEKKTVELKRYDKLSLFEIKRIIGEENQNENPIFDTLFNFIDFHVYGQLERGEEWQNAVSSPVEERPGLIEGGVNLNTFLDAHISTTGGQFSLMLTYSTRRMSDEWIVKLGGYFETILNKLIEVPGGIIAKEEFISTEEKQNLLFEFNGLREDRTPDKTIDELFEVQVKKIPHSIAVLHQDKQFTYIVLDEQGNQLAYLLLEKGLEPNRVVGLMVKRSVEMIIGILAILKAGGAYLPIDAEYPGERKRYMLEDSGVKLLLTDSNIGKGFEFLPGEIEIIDVCSKNIHIGDSRCIEKRIESSCLVYVMYTSGSTGNPKGVMLEHRNLVNLMMFHFNHTNIDHTRVLQFTTISFDVSFQEIFTTLLSGGELFLIDSETMTNPPALFGNIEKNRIRTLFFPVSFLRMIFNDINYIKLVPNCIKHIVTAGEQLVISDTLREFLQANHVYLHNHYGPTEAHVVTALTIDPQGEIPELPSIGKPVLNTVIYILDKCGGLLPGGIAGELHIGGRQVGRGYLGKKDLTLEKFIPDPFNAGGTLYKSGDLARWLADGNLEFLGRIDAMVKIRGFRVEPGEVESRLINNKQIKEAVVVIKESKSKDKFLCAYIVWSEGVESELNSTELREYLSQILPESMIPTYFIPIERIPLTSSGKIDRKALPEPEIKTGKDYVIPESEVEKTLAAIWSKVLGIERDVIGRESNFFELGGNSLNLISLMGELNKEFKIDMSFAQIIEYPGLMNLANFITKNIFFEKPMVLLNWKRKKIIFCFPEQEGLGYGYFDLGMLLEDYSLYSFAYLETEDRIIRYIDMITSIQPNGPYVFLGHSAAGKLAFVIAAALEKRDYEVSDIIFADCFFSENAVIPESEEFFKRFRTNLGNFLKQTNAEFLLDRAFVKAKKYMKYLNTIVRLEKVNANVHLILSEELQGNTRVHHCWDNLTTKTARVYNGWGTHRRMLVDKDLEKNKEIIKEILDEIDFGI